MFSDKIFQIMGFGKCKDDFNKLLPQAWPVLSSKFPITESAKHDYFYL